MNLSTVHTYDIGETDLLIVGDPHAHPDHDNERFEWLGRFAAEMGVGGVVCLGDLADMPSLSSYDRKKLSFEGRRYKRDVAAALDAQDKIDDAFHKAGGKSIHWFLCGGNHDEDRIGRMVNENSELEGLISVQDLKYEEFGWTYAPYKETLIVNGVAFSHYFASGVMGRPIGGERPALSLINKLHMSAVCGHNHLFDLAHRTKPTGERTIGLSAGCFVHPDEITHPGGWNRNTAMLWWNGLIILRNVKNGMFETEQYAMHRIKKMMSNARR